MSKKIVRVIVAGVAIVSATITMFSGNTYGSIRRRVKLKRAIGIKPKYIRNVIDFWDIVDRDEVRYVAKGDTDNIVAVKSLHDTIEINTGIELDLDNSIWLSSMNSYFYKRAVSKRTDYGNKCDKYYIMGEANKVLAELQLTKNGYICNNEYELVRI